VVTAVFSSADVISSDVESDDLAFDVKRVVNERKQCSC